MDKTKIIKNNFTKYLKLDNFNNYWEYFQRTDIIVNPTETRTVISAFKWIPG